MRRTFLAGGIAVLTSMLFAPHRDEWEWLGQMFYVRPIMATYLSTDPNAGLEPASTPYNPTLPPHSDYGKRDAENRLYYVKQPGYVPRWCSAWRWFPVFWLEDHNPILWGNFAGQTAFLAVLTAVLANLRNSKSPPPERRVRQ